MLMELPRFMNTVCWVDKISTKWDFKKFWRRSIFLPYEDLTQTSSQNHGYSMDLLIRTLYSGDIYTENIQFKRFRQTDTIVASICINLGSSFCIYTTQPLLPRGHLLVWMSVSMLWQASRPTIITDESEKLTHNINTQACMLVVYWVPFQYSKFIHHSLEFLTLCHSLPRPLNCRGHILKWTGRSRCLNLKYLEFSMVSSKQRHAIFI